MQTIWSRVAQVRCSSRRSPCGLPTCALRRRNATASGFYRLSFADAVTLFYTSAFGLAAIADAKAKDDRQDEWDRKIAGLKEETLKSKERTIELLELRKLHHEEKKLISDLVLPFDFKKMLLADSGGFTHNNGIRALSVFDRSQTALIQSVIAQKQYELVKRDQQLVAERGTGDGKESNVIVWDPDQSSSSCQLDIHSTLKDSSSTNEYNKEMTPLKIDSEGDAALSSPSLEVEETSEDPVKKRLLLKELVVGRLIAKFLLFCQKPDKDDYKRLSFYDLRRPRKAGNIIYHEDFLALRGAVRSYNCWLKRNMNGIPLKPPFTKRDGSPLPCCPTYHFYASHEEKRQQSRQLNYLLDKEFREFDPHTGILENLITSISILLAREVGPSITAFRILLQYFRLFRMNYLIPIVCEAIRDIGWKYDVAIASTILRMYVKGNDKKYFYTLLEDLKSPLKAPEPWHTEIVNGTSVIVPPINSGIGIFRVLVEGTLKFRRYPETNAYVEILLSRKLQPDTLFLTSMLKFCARRMFWDQGMRIWAHLRAAGGGRTIPEAYYWMLWLCIRCKRKAHTRHVYVHVLQDIYDNNVDPAELRMILNASAWDHVQPLKDWKQTMFRRRMTDKLSQQFPTPTSQYHMSQPPRPWKYPSL